MRQAVVVVDAPEQRLAREFALLDGDNREKRGVVLVGRRVWGELGVRPNRAPRARVSMRARRDVVLELGVEDGYVVGVARAQRDVVAAE